MIFVCTGTQVYQFNRLLKELDRLVENGQINEEIFAQIGASDYEPRHYAFKKFISVDEFKECQDKATLIISHGGAGSLIGASKKGKNIIAVPRLAKYGEHTDDHQLQIIGILEKEGYVRVVYDMNDLGRTIAEAIESPIKKIYERESNTMSLIETFICSH